MSDFNATISSRSTTVGAATSDEKGSAENLPVVQFSRHEKKITNIPVSLEISSLPQKSSTHKLRYGKPKCRSKLHEVGQILLAPHVYVKQRREAKIYSGDVLGMGHYWPAIVLKQFVSSYLCVPIHSFNGRGPSTTDAEGREEYMYITSDGKLTPCLERERVDITRVLAVSSIDTDYSQPIFNPKEGATITVASHFDLPATIGYEVLGSITAVSLKKLLQFYSELHEFDKGHLNRETQLKDELQILQRESVAEIETLSAEVQRVTSERNALQARLTEKNEEFQRAGSLKKSNTALTESNVALAKKNKSLDCSIESIRNHHRTESQAWQKSKERMTKRIESQNNTIALQEETITHERAANEKLTNTVKGQQATIVTQVADLAKEKRVRDVSQELIYHQKIKIERMDRSEERHQAASGETDRLLKSLQSDYDDLADKVEKSGKAADAYKEVVSAKDRQIECLKVQVECLEALVRGKDQELTELKSKIDAVLVAKRAADEEKKPLGKLSSFSRFLGGWK